MSSPEKEFKKLVGIIARLRAPDGCPWDRLQTHASLRENLLEEAYEVLEALDSAQPPKLRGELGDLLMQIVLHSQIAAEAAEFDMAGVISDINAKLIRRHPHIFSQGQARDAEEVAHNWELLKQEERAPGTSILSGVPPSMPALASSHSIQRRVAHVGFDWKETEGVIEKLAEEVAEFREAATPEERSAEFGDLLFTLVNVARRLGIDSEAALRESNRRFARRFGRMEELCRERGLALDKMSLDEQNALWEEAKRETG